ncbi:Eco57I restriction-modification methylase domain-containing protein [Yeosuana sp.]|uniref:Eco57I restriction-modification methylase domain-containing protein n=1 Tax=Yeosuana sp. TaxID=2529388 RepID=UPI004054D913
MSQLTNLINKFSNTNLIAFLRENNKIPSLKMLSENLDYLFQEEVFDKYESIEKIGEATINKDDLIIIAAETSEPITERTGKKNQYEIAKKILKHEVKDAALFVFYDSEGNFRFSFVKANYLGTKREFTEYKRYTYFVSPKQTNKTFIKQIGSCGFSSLNEIIEAFSVEPLNKQFYQEIAKAFYELIGGKYKQGTKTINADNPQLVLPSTPLKDNRKIYQEFAVRLIGRTIFCWFLKNKKSEAGISLIPETWLSSNTVVEVNNQQHDFYHTVLEKLFFLVLNKREEDRKDYTLPQDSNIIPFLNGGLFEAHPDDFFPTDSQGIHQIAFGLKIPNAWFLELFKVLEQYNFTIDENSIYDAEVSIDPEMLGTIFENLLAEIDPDTEKSARKATGSFYTPREIVDYMVEQSLVQYLKTKTTINDEEALERLFKEGQETNQEDTFNSKEKDQILLALSDVKILDPACGSGAFPMGALHKIILALKKLDPSAKWWKQKQLEKVSNALIRNQLKEKLDAATSDYARKLGVIQHSIYGVDIQPIASEISKLRSFLSLVIDENIDDNALNRGIEPLPNLEFKFVTANTLIGLPEEQGQQISMFDNYEELQLLEQLRADYLQSSGKKKEKIKERFLRVQKKAFKNEHNLFADTNSRSYKLISWNPFSNEASSWFDPKWMYGVDKFDIVIGNPPYGVSVNGNYRQEVLHHLVKVPDYEIYYFFIEAAKKYLNFEGIKSYIIPNTFLFNVYASNYREELLDTWTMSIIDCTAFKIFEKATVLNAIMISKYKSGKGVNFKKTKKAHSFNKLVNRNTQFILNEKLLKFNQNWSLAFRLDNNVVDLIQKLKDNSKPLIEFFPEISQGLIAYDKYRGQDEEIIKSRAYHYNSFSKSDLKKWLWGGDITKFNIQWNRQEWIDYCDGIANPRNPKFFNEERILIREITNPSIFAAYTDEELYHDPALLVVLNSKLYNIWVLLGFLNSKLATFFHFNYSPKATKGAFPKIIIEDVKNFPLMEIEDEMSKRIESIAKELFSSLELDKALLNELDILIYKLYYLTHQEVLLIDPTFSLTEEAYNNYNSKTVNNNI